MLIPLKWWKIKWTCKVKFYRDEKHWPFFFLHASLPKQHYRQITANCYPQNSKLTQWSIIPSCNGLSESSWPLWLNIYMLSQKTTSQDEMFQQLWFQRARCHLFFLPCSPLPGYLHSADGPMAWITLHLPWTLACACPCRRRQIHFLCQKVSGRTSSMIFRN